MSTDFPARIDSAFRDLRALGAEIANRDVEYPVEAATFEPGAAAPRIDKPECIFCEIVAGRSPGSVFYEDEFVLGLMTIGPVTEGRAMDMPRRDAASMADLDEASGPRLWTVMQCVAAALRASGVRCEGVRLFLADGEAASQEAFHVHLHMAPRSRGDPFKVVADWDAKPPPAELDRVVAQIRGAYGESAGE